ncbi:hypothetical protein ACRYCC_41255 [Actinomadura scrupuli]|uniref:hypothetical protein n=1 Tax=Actinomadura scrupuli TaxID=559629 RepID=UPI003D964EDB
MRTTFAKHLGTAALAAVAALTATAPATALAAPASTPAPPSPVPDSSAQKPVTGTKSFDGAASGALASTTCDSIGNNRHSWWANCRVNSGSSRAWTYCSDGRFRYGSWVGVGYWKFGGSCGPFRLRDYGIQISD